MARYDAYIGIDYSGAGTPDQRLPGLRAHETLPDGTSRPLAPAAGRNWTRREMAGMLLERALAGEAFVAGLDHCFSMPMAYFIRYGLGSWDELLRDFVRHWPCAERGATVETFRKGNPRTGESGELRLCERWTAGARSVFEMDAQGQVGKSSHAGIPWLPHIREKAGGRIHFWPYDGWEPPAGKAMMAEAFPAPLRRRYPRRRTSMDEHDAYVVSRWLRDMDARGALDLFASPPLTREEFELAALEGWIFGVM